MDELSKEGFELQSRGEESYRLQLYCMALLGQRRLLVRLRSLLPSNFFQSKLNWVQPLSFLSFLLLARRTDL